jgi:putative membrane protein insertion efficiency factor
MSWVGCQRGVEAVAPVAEASSPTQVATWPTKALCAVVRGYQLARVGRLSPCRFVPSCSEYAIEALARHGAARGTWLAIRRVSRCHPLAGWGVDPVPR